MLFVIIILTRKSYSWQCFFLVIICARSCDPPTPVCLAPWCDVHLMLTGGGCAVGLVQMTETINRYGSANWDLFATQVTIRCTHMHSNVPCSVFNGLNNLTVPPDCSMAVQNYFDKHGVFMSTVVSLPLLLMSAFMVRLSPTLIPHSPCIHSAWQSKACSLQHTPLCIYSDIVAPAAVACCATLGSRLVWQVFSGVWQCGSLLITVKTRQIKGELRAKAKAAKAAGNTEGGSKKKD